jgi:hypothetical protein
MARRFFGRPRQTILQAVELAPMLAGKCVVKAVDRPANLTMRTLFVRARVHVF